MMIMDSEKKGAYRRMKGFQQFFEQLKKDEALQKKLEEAGKSYTGEQTEEAVFNAVVLPVAKEAGYDFTLEEMKKTRLEMDLDELAQVEGGWGFGATACIVIGVGIGIPISKEDCAGGGCFILGGGKGATACAGSGVGKTPDALKKKDETTHTMAN